MLDVKTQTLKDCHHEDLEDVVFSIEKTLNIHFEDNEISHIKTFGEFCDIVLGKMEGEAKADCTSQQAFYRIRNAFVEVLEIDKKTIFPDSQLNDFLPEKVRREKIKRIEQLLGFKLHVLEPPLWISIPLGVLFVVSLFVLIFHWQMGLAGIFGSLLLISIANRLGNVLSWDTMGELAEKVVQNNYIEARRNPNTYNPNEVVKLIKNHFKEILDLEDDALNPESTF